MANAVTITIKDRSKTAICKETLALCGQYSVTVSGMDGNGYLVLHDRKMLPKNWPYCPDTVWAGPNCATDENRWYGYCELTSGAGTLDLSMTPLVTKLTKTCTLNEVTSVVFSVYKTGEGLIGTGDMPILVTEPYEYTTQSFISFKGDKGDTGDAAGFGAITATANTLEAGSSATAGVTATGPDTAKAMAFTFGIPKGQDAGYGTISATASTLDPGSSATASVETSGEFTAKNFAFSFGIPRGYNAGFGTPTADVEQLDEHDDPTVSVEASGPNTAKVFDFSFGIPAGIMPKPAVGTVTEVGPSGTTAVQIRSGTQATEYPILDFWIQRGRSAYELAVDNGYTGTVTQWLSSLIGGDYEWIQRQLATVASFDAKIDKTVINHQAKLDELDDVKVTTNDEGEATLKIRVY